uniref:Uncharacterized protein n=1 Tax=Romanomermis culicivorax TaxID=13658 RepID=A0A915HQL7_ROMCU
MELDSKKQQSREARIVKTCPLCHQNPIEYVKDDLENLTGQKCGYCSSVVCTQCGHVCSIPLGGNDYTSLWLCRMCVDRSDASADQGRQTQSFLEKVNEAEMKIVEDHDHYSILSSTLINKTSIPKDDRQTIKIASGGSIGDFDSDESDEEIDTSDDDYPDEVIEVPPVVTSQTRTSILDEETAKLIEKQDEYGSDVLAEITKTFAAGQSFDVDEMYKKSKNILISQKSMEKSIAQTSDQKQSTNPFDQIDIPPPPIPARSMVNQPLPLPAYQPKAPGGKFEQDIHIYNDDDQFEGKEQTHQVGGDLSSPKTYHHTNLDYEEINESPKEPRGPMNEDEVDMGVSNAEDEIDYAQAMRYYNSQPFYTHRSGPVYTIPEDEEENEEVKATATAILPKASSTTTAAGKDTLLTLESFNEQQKQSITRSRSSASTESVAEVVGSLATSVTATIAFKTPMDIPTGMKSAAAHKNVTSVVSSKQYFEAYKGMQSSDDASSLYQVDGRSVQAVISSFPSVIPPPPPPPQPQQYAISSSNDNVASRSDTLSSLYCLQEAISSDEVHNAADQDDQAISKIAEMGRRKLPNIPQGMQSSTSQLIDPVLNNIYRKREKDRDVEVKRTSLGNLGTFHCLSITPDLYPCNAKDISSLMPVEDYGHQRQWRSASDASFLESETTATLPSSTMVFRPQSSTEVQQQQHHQTNNRASLVRCKSVPGNKGAQLFSGAKIPVTLARVLLKQELREALLRRSIQLEACEIEANQRQYNIHRHLLTGVYPRSVGLDSVPSRIKCSLPQQLVEGCHVEYKKPTSSTTTMLPSCSKYAEYTSAPTQRPFSASMQTLPYMSSMSTTATASEYFTRSNASTQFDASINASQSKRLVSGSSQTFAQDEDVYGSIKTTTSTLIYGNLSPKLKDADTQTKTFINAASIVKFNDIHTNYGANFVRSFVEKFFLNGRNTDQYLDVRKVRKHQKHRKAISAMDYFSDEDDDDQLTREIRKSKILSEIERRREKLLKQSLPYGAGYSLTSFDSRIGGAGASDYSSHIPHYGSLPRMDAYNHYGQDYGSLPRSSRCCDPYSIYGTLGFRQKVHPMYHSDLGYLSDLQDYGIGDRMLNSRNITMNTPTVSYDQYGQRYASRSLPYLDQLDRYHSGKL